MSLAYATTPARMKMAELASEAAKLRRKRETTSLTPGEEDRLASLKLEMDNRQRSRK